MTNVFVPTKINLLVRICAVLCFTVGPISSEYIRVKDIVYSLIIFTPY
jgi:hypothetical protein